jgi:hypothetical protein
LFAATNPVDKKKEIILSKSDSIKLGIDFLKKHIQPNTVWQSENPEILRTVNGLIHFAEDERIDTILVKLQKFQNNSDLRYISRSPENVSDSLQVQGYQDYRTILEKMKQLDRAIWNGVDMTTIPLPENLTADPNNKIQLIAEGDEEAIIRRTRIILPDSLKNVHAVQDSLGKAANDFNKIKNRQKARSFLLEAARQRFNTRIEKMNLDSAITAYRKYAVRVFSDSLQNQLSDSLKLRNQQILAHYNDSIVRSVNDSINVFVQTLQRYAQNDSVSVYVQSLSGKPSQLWLRNNQRAINRMYIKNIQNDSIGIQLMNIDKQTIGIAIEDNITFNRIAQKQHRDYVFQKFTPNQKLTKIQKKYDIIAPWDLGGNGTLGFTQMYLSNWKAGGRSAFSFLSVLKGYANYSNNGKLKWENSGEIRNGWIRQGDDIDQTQKNDDKLELISRLGVNAFKNWYYSAEIDFKTQFFNGYNYPNDSVPISTYMSPATTFIKLGLDYKPNKNFSLFLSPITAKYVFVRDTALIDQTKYGVSATSRSFWEPGLNVDLRYKIDFTPRISYETKYKMFLNYQQPFQKVDINWENMIVAQLTNRISMTFMLYMLYDDNVTFPTGKFEADGTEIYKAKWQTKQLTTVGFSYKINKHIYQRKKI